MGDELDRPTLVEIKRVVAESPTVKTFYFDYPPAAGAQPGQFVMVYIVGVDEIPMSLSRTGSAGTSITVRRVGEATERLHRLVKGDLIGVRGPYGRGFLPPRKGRALAVAGGIGVASVLPLIRLLCSTRRVNVSAALGFSTRKELLFVKEIRDMVEPRGSVLIATDDGSYGAKGLVTDLTLRLLDEEKFEAVFSCGRESMLRDLYELCKERGIAFQASLERRIRCSIGICGSCCIGRYRVCKDGPVFSDEQLGEVEDEFGSFTRDAHGRKVGF